MSFCVHPLVANVISSVSDEAKKHSAAVITEYEKSNNSTTSREDEIHDHRVLGGYKAALSSESLPTPTWHHSHSCQILTRAKRQSRRLRPFLRSTASASEPAARA